MFSVNKISDNYYLDPASDIICYFLSNATTWKGENARRIKLELNLMLPCGDPVVTQLPLET